MTEHLRRWGKGNLDALVNRPKIIEDGIAPHYDQYYYLMFLLPILLKANIMVETGLGWGISSKIHLESLSLMNPPGELHTYELNDTQYKHGTTLEEIVKQIQSCGFKSTWNLHLIDSVQGGKEWDGPKINLLYLDSDHSLTHVNNELDAWIPNMAEKAIVYTDDIWCHNEPHDAINQRNKGECPTDPYWAIADYCVKNPEWKQITMSYPEGKAFMLRGFDVQ